MLQIIYILFFSYHFPIFSDMANTPIFTLDTAQNTNFHRFHIVLLHCDNIIKNPLEMQVHSILSISLLLIFFGCPSELFYGK